MIVLFVVATLVLLLSLVVLLYGFGAPSRGAVVGGVLLLAVAVVAGGFSFTYRQTVGEAKVQRAFTGDIVATTTETGMYARAPWDKILTFDVFANVRSFGPDGTAGEAFTFQDSEGVSGEVGLQVTYNLDPESIESILRSHGSQEMFIENVIDVAIVEEAKKVTVTRSTLENYTDRAITATELQDALTERVGPLGVVVTEVAIDDLLYPEDVVQRFSDAQAARTEIEKAKAEQERVKVEAATAIEKARGEAEANRIVAESLTPEVLEQSRIDALTKAGGVWVVPEGSTPLITTDGGSKG